MCDAHTLPKDPVGRSPLSLLSESACLNPHEGCPFFQALGACEAMPWSQDQEWVIRLAVGGEAGEAPDGPGLLQPSFRGASWAALPSSCDVYMIPGEAAAVT